MNESKFDFMEFKKILAQEETAKKEFEAQRAETALLNTGKENPILRRIYDETVITIEELQQKLTGGGTDLNNEERSKIDDRIKKLQKEAFRCRVLGKLDVK